MVFKGYAFRLGMAVSAVTLALLHPLLAQPSGGPYGPVRQTYEIPKDVKHVYYVSPDGRDDEDGRSIDHTTTLSSAILNAVTGDAIILRGGMYRIGDLIFNQGITLQPYRDEQPVLKGSRIATDWEPLLGSLWRTEWKTLFPLSPQSWWAKKNNLRTTPVHLFNNDMVFIDGKSLATKSYPAELDENSFCVDYDEGYVYIGADPTNRTVEITAYDNALTRTVAQVNGKTSDGIGPAIRGITFTQYAYRAIEIEGYDPEQVSPEQEHGKDVIGTVLEDCTLSYCSRVGAYLRGDKMIIRHNRVSDTGTEGLFILASNDVLIEKNVVTRNNSEGIMGYFSTAVKIFNQCHRVTCNDNLIIDNLGDSSGIWYDVGNVDGVFINNWVENTDNGFFFEISRGVVCAGNVFVNCDTGSQVLNSSGAKLYQNTYVNSRATFMRTNRGAGADHFGWHPQSGPAVEERHGHEFGNNLLAANPSFESPLLQVKQDPVLQGKLTKPMFDYADFNVYVRGNAGGLLMKTADSPEAQPSCSTVLSWAPMEVDDNQWSREFEALEEFQSLKLGFENSSISLPDYNGPLFQGKRPGHYAPVKKFANRVTGGTLPESVKAVLSDEYSEVDFPGCFLPIQAADPRPVSFDYLAYSGKDDLYDAAGIGKGEYYTPILAGFYPDPTICRAGKDYYLVNSTFEYFPGLPIFHSTDLVNWKQIGNVIHRPGQFDYKAPNVNGGLYAPAIAYHDGTFYVICTMIEGPGNFVVTAEHPTGPWSDPIPLNFGGIDPSIFFDDDGRVWVVNNDDPEGDSLYEGHRAVRIQELDLEKMEMVGPRSVLVNGGVDLSEKPIWIEGPHIFKRDGWYYLCCAEGGTGPGHSQVIFRSKTVDGPYIPWEKNPILTQRDLDGNIPGAVTCTGHADLEIGPDGNWWAVFLAMRPYENGLSPMGRETFMLPVEWTDDGWPLILPQGERVPLKAKAPKGAARKKQDVPLNGSFGWREEFKGKELSPDWIMIREPNETWWQLSGGKLELTPRAASITGAGNPSYLARRVQHHIYSAETELEIPKDDHVSAGLALVMNEKYHYFLAVKRAGGKARIYLEQVNGGEVKEIRSAVLEGQGNVALKINVDKATCSFAYKVGKGDWTSLVKDADAKIITTGIDFSAMFLGATVGPHVRIDDHMKTR